MKSAGLFARLMSMAMADFRYAFSAERFRREFWDHRRTLIDYVGLGAVYYLILHLNASLWWWAFSLIAWSAFRWRYWEKENAEQDAKRRQSTGGQTEPSDHPNL